MLRVNGDAFVTDDPDLLDVLAGRRQPAVLATTRVQKCSPMRQGAHPLAHVELRTLPGPKRWPRREFHSAIGAEMGEFATTMGIDVSGLDRHHQRALRDDLVLTPVCLPVRAEAFNGHMEFMSPTDSMFLIAETRHPFHVGGLAFYEPPAGAGRDFVRELHEKRFTPTFSP